MDEAEQILRKGDVEKVAEDWRMRTYLLAEALYQSVHMQLDLVRYRAIGVDRGATLASAENPLNNRRWLRAQFERIRALPDEAARLKELQAIVDWTDPGPGGFYDDLGNAQLQPHLVRGVPFEEDPGPYRSGATGFGFRPEWRLSWVTHAESFYDAPLTLKYPELDASARYKLRVIYAGDPFSPAKIRIVANGQTEISPFTREAESGDAGGVRHSGGGDRGRLADARFHAGTRARRRGPRLSGGGSVADSSGVRAVTIDAPGSGASGDAPRDPQRDGTREGQRDGQAEAASGDAGAPLRAPERWCSPVKERRAALAASPSSASPRRHLRPGPQ